MTSHPVMLCIRHTTALSMTLGLLLLGACSGTGSQSNEPQTDTGTPTTGGGSGMSTGTSDPTTTTGSGGGGLSATGGGGGVPTGTGGGGVSNGGSAGTGTGGTAGASTTASSGGSGGNVSEACVFECVGQCVAMGGTKEPGVCAGEQDCCSMPSIPPDPLAHLVVSARETGLLLANRFSQQTLSYSSISDLPPDGYKNACEWYGSLAVAQLTNSRELLEGLVAKFEPFRPDFVVAMSNGQAHVDRYIFGIVPLEIYLQTGDESALRLGLDVADRQQATDQTRDAIDDMFMMTSLQLQAYRASGEAKYIDFMANTMAQYLTAQQDNGLFFHNLTEARVYWARGNGWFAAGMAEMMRDLPNDHPQYAVIEAGYLKMMQGLLPLQSDAGLWYQVLDMPEAPSNWEESSGTAMFTYAMVAGVRRGVLDATSYGPVIEAAWSGLRAKTSAQGHVSDICEGTWYHTTPEEYMALHRLTGDGHGQAPMLWIAAELLRE